MAAPKRQPFEIERDRAAITAMYLRGQTQQVIGEQLGLSRQQIGYDLGKIQEGWRTQTALALDEHKAKELAKLDLLERIHWESWVESKQDKGFLDGILRVIQQRCKILGLEVPSAVIQQNLLVNNQVNQVNVDLVTPQQLAEYASVIRGIAAQREDDTVEPLAEPTNGHRSFKV